MNKSFQLNLYNEIKLLSVFYDLGCKLQYAPKMPADSVERIKYT